MKFIGCVIVAMAVVLFGAMQSEATPPPYYSGCSDWALGADGYWYRACHVSRSYHFYGNAAYYPPATISLSSASRDDEFSRELFAAYKAKAEQHEALLNKLIAAGTLPSELKALAPPHPGKVLEEKTCTRCHSAEDGAKDGGRHVFYRGGAWIGSKEDAELAVKQVRAGKMPRGPVKFSADDKFDWLDWVTQPATGTAAAVPPKVEAPKKAMPPVGSLPDVSFRSPRP